MTEQRRSEGRLVTLENVTAASNMVAGTLIGLSGHMAYTLGSGTTGFGATATPGYSFAGVLDADVSAGESPITVWAEGVFELPLNSASDSGIISQVGNPVWVLSGILGAPGATGDAALGSLVGMATWGNTAAGYVQVKINPMRYRWTIYVPAATATQAAAGAYPASSY